MPIDPFADDRKSILVQLISSCNSNNGIRVGLYPRFLFSPRVAAIVWFTFQANRARKTYKLEWYTEKQSRPWHLPSS